MQESMRHAMHIHPAFTQMRFAIEAAPIDAYAGTQRRKPRAPSARRVDPEGHSIAYTNTGTNI
jgi:hypothetical protein